MSEVMMKSRIETKVFHTAAVLLCSAGLLASVAIAQQDSTPPPPPQTGQTQGPPQGGGPGGRGGDPERRIEMVQKHLNLSDDQTAQFKTIMETQRSKMEALRADTTTAPADKRSQMMAIHQDADTKIHAMLSPEQAKKYDAMEAKQRERAQERRGGGNAPANGAGTPPPPPSLM
jgi:Spy/CpxP family protein refolding chaperone